MQQADRFSPITQGARLRSFEVGHLTLTETAHPPALQLPPHRHQVANIMIVLRGSFTETSNGESHECGPANVIVKPPALVHSDSYGRAGASCLIIEMKPPLLEGAELADHMKHFETGIPCVLAARLCEEFRMMDSTSTLAMEGLALEILAHALRNQRGESGTPAWLLQARDLIHETFTQRVSLSEIAEAVGVHSSHLSRAFRSHYRCTMGEYIRQLRLEYAIRQLTDSDKPLLEIALEAGFYDQSHFTHLFKLHTGITPVEFVRSVKRRRSS